MSYEYWFDIKDYFEMMRLSKFILEISYNTIAFLVKRGIKVDINDTNFNELIENFEKAKKEGN